MSTLFGFGGGDDSEPVTPPKDIAGEKARLEELRKRQAGGLATQTNLSGFRNMITSYQGLKPTLGAG